MKPRTVLFSFAFMSIAPQFDLATALLGFVIFGALGLYKLLGEHFD